MDSSKADEPPSTGPSVREYLREGQVIPAHPLALNAERKLDTRSRHNERSMSDGSAD